MAWGGRGEGGRRREMGEGEKRRWEEGRGRIEGEKGVALWHRSWVGFANANANSEQYPRSKLMKEREDGRR